MGRFGRVLTQFTIYTMLSGVGVIFLILIGVLMNGVVGQISYGTACTQVGKSGQRNRERERERERRKAILRSETRERDHSRERERGVSEREFESERRERRDRGRSVGRIAVSHHSLKASGRSALPWWLCGLSYSPCVPCLRSNGSGVISMLLAISRLSPASNAEEEGVE